MFLSAILDMKKEILELQQYMQGHHYDAFLVETADEHQSEYVGDYYKVRAYLSNFTGRILSACV